MLLFTCRCVFNFSFFVWCGSMLDQRRSKQARIAPALRHSRSLHSHAVVPADNQLTPAQATAHAVSLRKLLPTTTVDGGPPPPTWLVAEGWAAKAKMLAHKNLVFSVLMGMCRQGNGDDRDSVGGSSSEEGDGNSAADLSVPCIDTETDAACVALHAMITNTTYTNLDAASLSLQADVKRAEGKSVYGSSAAVR
eukprot:SAG31_NODE_7672_length_1621_cov_1.750986_2_plen_193_part_01